MKKILVLLIGGNLLAQLINLIFLPVSTRLYKPEVFNELAVFITFLIVVSTVAGLRFDKAILKCKDYKEAIICLYLAMCFSLIISFIICIVFIVIEICGFNNPIKYPWLLPPLIVLVVLYNSLFNLTNIREEYKKLSKSRVKQSIVSNTILTVWGTLIATPFGIFLGYSLMYGAGVFNLFIGFEKVSKLEIIEVFKKNINYPKYSVIEAFGDVAGYQIPIAMIGLLYQNYLAAYLFIGIKLLNVPLSILGRAISSMYISKIRNEGKNFNLNKNIILITVICVFPTVIYSLILNKLDVIILGEEWKGVGRVVFLLLPWFILQMITTALNSVFYIFSQEKNIYYLHLFGGIFRISIIALFAFAQYNHIIEVFSLVNTFFYLTWIVFIYMAFQRYSGVKNV